jgi:hypothetical protein
VKTYYTTVGIVALLLIGGLWWMMVEGPLNFSKIWTGYAANARTPLFTSFVTLGSFLLTLKTTILQRLKEAFNTKQQRFLYRAFRAENPERRFYASLENISAALALNILLALGSSAIQMSLGFLEHPLPLAICIAAPITTLIFVFYLTFQIFSVHREWFKHIEDEVQCQIQKEDDEDRLI